MNNKNGYWLIYDTYPETNEDIIQQNMKEFNLPYNQARMVKKLAWDFGFTMVKQYTLHKNVVHDDLWETFLKWFRSYLGVDKIQRVLGLGDYAPERLGGATRSPQWPTVRAAHLKENPVCAICGGNKKITVHHCLPFHVDQSLELRKDNLITLCEEGGSTGNHHLTYGHFDNFRTKWNPLIKDESKIWLSRFSAKTEREIFPDEQDTSV